DVDFLQGWSFALVRNEKAKQICQSMIRDRAIIAKDVTRKEALDCNKMMSTEKRWRAFRIIETHRRQGKPIPAYGRYGLEMPKSSGKQFLKTELNMLTHALCFTPRFRISVLKFFLGSGGYYLLWLNSLRRRVRDFIRDNIALFKRKLFGRK
ncbi:MAG: hypothetical protein SGJ02_02295, partial [bacterium]|nr:hypothetical protein [bacterium]